MLDTISVLPADVDKGILPVKTAGKIPENEEVHEITMDYELNLPGEHLSEFAVSETPKSLFPTSFADTFSTAAAVLFSIAMSAFFSDILSTASTGSVFTFSSGSTSGTTVFFARGFRFFFASSLTSSFMTNYSCGPSVTRYEMVPEQGVKVSKITGLADDIMMNLAAQSIRIEAPIPGKSAVGIHQSFLKPPAISLHSV